MNPRVPGRMDLPADDSRSPWRGVSTRHYENFPVGSILLPASQRPVVAALYAFARHADDVADEGDAPTGHRLEELQRLRRAVLAASPSGDPRVDRLTAFAEPFGLDRGLMTDLIDAFAQDLIVTRYATRNDLLDYCRRSANPVGRLILQAFGYGDAARAELSDAICSALQLVNFLQDIAIDWRKQRVYLPLDALRAAGTTDASVGRSVDNGYAEAALRACIREQARFARSMLERGRPLARRVPWRLGLELRMILAGATLVLDKLEATGCDPISRRPRLRASDLPRLVARVFA